MGIKTRIIPLILILAFSFPVAFAENGITVNTDKQFYETGELLSISGQIEVKKMPILALRIFDPNGSILSANNVEIEEDNTFTKTVSLDSPFYDKPGIYKITIDYGKLDKETTFEIISKDVADVPIIEEHKKIISEVTSLGTDKNTYADNDTIIISGTVSSIDDATVLIGIHDPFGLPTGFYFGKINSNNEFTVSFLAKAGVNFKIDGTYTVLAHYGESKSQISFDFVKAIKPEIKDKAEKKQPGIVDKEIEAKDTTIIEKEIPKPKQPKLPEKEITKQAPSIIIKEKVTETKETNKSEKQSTQLIEKKPVEADNLSVEDIELGILLNQISLNCDQSEYIDTVTYYDGMGPAMIRLCKYTDAITFFDKELVKDPNNVEILTNKGTSLAKLGYFEEAILYYDNALDINSSFIPALNNKANALSKLGEFEKAVIIYNAAKNLEPNNKILNKNLSVLKTKFSSLEKNQEQSLKNPTQIPNNEKIERTQEIKLEKKSSTPDLLEQIGIIFSSLGSMFGFH